MNDKEKPAERQRRSGNTGRIIKKKLTINYTVIPNELIQMPDISYRAKGLMAYILSLPLDWVINITELPNHSTEGIKATRAAFNELVKAGYIQSKRITNAKNQFIGWNHTAYNTPQSVPLEQIGPIGTKAIVGNGKVGKGTLLSKHIVNTNLLSKERENAPSSDRKVSKQKKTFGENNTSPNEEEKAEAFGGAKIPTLEEVKKYSSDAQISDAQFLDLEKTYLDRRDAKGWKDVVNWKPDFRVFARSYKKVEQQNTPKGQEEKQVYRQPKAEPWNPNFYSAYHKRNGTKKTIKNSIYTPNGNRKRST